MKLDLENISPKIAAELLATSYGNRPINKPTVLEYAVAMDSDKWSPTASKIDLDEKGRLVNGHHRLEAVILAQRTVSMLVHRGVPTSDRDIIDTGRSRTLNDITRMYTNRQNVNNWNAALQTCVSLLMAGTARRPKLKSLDTAKRWERLFADGLNFVVSYVVAPGVRRNNRFRVGAITGALAFAHKRNPAAVKSFTKALVLGENLTSDMPVYIARSAVLGDRAQLAGGGGVSDASLKILSALFATIKGSSYRTAQAGREGMIYFREAYDTAQVESLMAPFLKFTEKRKAEIAALAVKAKTERQQVGKKVGP